MCGKYVKTGMMLSIPRMSFEVVRGGSSLMSIYSLRLEAMIVTLVRGNSYRDNEHQGFRCVLVLGATENTTPATGKGNESMCIPKEMGIPLRQWKQQAISGLRFMRPVAFGVTAGVATYFGSAWPYSVKFLLFLISIPLWLLFVVFAIQVIRRAVWFAPRWGVSG